jgi:hypothetical protein
MRDNIDRPITAALDILERSARNDTRAHIPATLARALIEHPAWAAYVETRRQELIASWAGSGAADPKPSGAGLRRRASSSDEEAREVLEMGAHLVGLDLPIDGPEAAGKAAGRRLSREIAAVPGVRKRGA